MERNSKSIMALDWPNAIPSRGSRHRHLRRRAAAYASALYYGECSASGISPDGAAAAEEDARSRRSRWWLRGSDPNHPSLRIPARRPEPEGLGAKSLRAEAAEEEGEEGPKPGSESVEEARGEARTDDEDDSAVAEVQDQEQVDDIVDDDGLEDDSNVPILARDDDLGTGFGTLSEFRASRDDVSPPGTTSDVAARKHPHVVPTRSPASPSWPAAPRRRAADGPVRVFKRDAGSCEEVLDSYSACPNRSPSDDDKNRGRGPAAPADSEEAPPPSVARSPPGAAHQVTSESDDADDSVRSGESSREPRFRGVAPGAAGGRSRKRSRVDLASPLGQTFVDARINDAKAELLSRLGREGVGSPAFRSALASLEKYSKLRASSCNKKRRGAAASADIDGTWLTLSPPEYPSCLGKNSDGDRMFTLGRMSFDMYEPSDLVCSIQRQYNTIKSVEPEDLPLYVPKSLRREVNDERGRGNRGGRLKTYNIIASFTIEDAGSTSRCGKPLRGILTNYGYSLPDPNVPDRKSIWFTGGTIEPADDDMLDEWRRIFGGPNGGSGPVDAVASEATSAAAPVEERARSLASRILLGAVREPMDGTGTAGFRLNRPIGGHGSAYCDVVHVDDDGLRVMRGHSGSVYVFERV